MYKTLYLPDREKDSFQRHCRLSRLLSSGQTTIFDVGANIGQSIKRYSKELPACRITSFEPNPEAFLHLESTWGHFPGITLNQIALTDYIGEASFYVTRVSEASSLLKPTNHIIEMSSERKYDHDEITVSAMTLDYYCQTHNVEKIDILKLDVQGAELSVLKGSEALLDEKRIPIVFTEITFAETYIHQTHFIDIVSFLNRFDYDIWDIGSFLYTRNERIWAANLTFIHSSFAAIIESKEKNDSI